MKVRAKLIENRQVYVTTATRALVVDEPAEAGGDAMGPSDMELLLASLGASTVSAVARRAAEAAIPLEAVWVDVHNDSASAIHRTIHVRGQVCDEDIERLRRAAEACPVQQLLRATLSVATDVRRA